MQNKVFIADKSLWHLLFAGLKHEMLFTFYLIPCSLETKSSRFKAWIKSYISSFCLPLPSFPALKDLTALAKELRELRTNEETSRPPRKVTDYSSSSEDSESSEEEDGEGGAHDGTVSVSDIPRIMWVLSNIKNVFSLSVILVLPIYYSNVYYCFELAFIFSLF